MRGTGKRHGSTLIELLIAFAIMTTGLLGILAMLTQSIALLRTDMEQRRTNRSIANATELEALRPHVSAELHAELETRWLETAQADTR